ncbi:nose resistant to fluoxetine protein 6-like [Ptychodera flava]|uniref:nose resistant to fluoxetine protein 6-like n=1 Tax=Ptychodera flava TaxID=63121 RepID=UPI00396A9005
MMAKQFTALCCIVAAILLSSAAEAQNIMDGTFEELRKSLTPNATNPFKNVTEKCYWDTVQYMFDFTLFKKPYSREMYYSSAYFREDYDLTWNTKDPGNFHMCRQVKPGNETTFEATYCYTLTIFPARGDTLSKGVCYPNSCTPEDIQILVRQGLISYPTVPPWIILIASCAEESYELRTSDIVAITLCAVLAAVLISGTTYDLIQRHRAKSDQTEATEPVDITSNKIVDEAEAEAEKPQNGYVIDTPHQEILEVVDSEEERPNRAAKCKKFLSNCLVAFSVLNAGRKILSPPKGSRSIGCLNGIRVLSMFWLILYHTWLFLGSSWSYLDNPRYVTEEVRRRLATQALVAGDLGVEAFLVLSGLLVTYLTLRQIDRNGGPLRVNWGLFYLHRYWRLTPVYAFCLMMYTTLTLHMGNGVWWNSWLGAQEICQERWWANMFYFHNLYPYPGTVSECMGWTWYLSVDMQLFIFSPIFILLFYKSWIGGTVVSVILSLGSFTYNAYISYVQGRTIGGDPELYNEPKYDEGAWLYTKPFYRLPQYLVGVALGYVIFRLKGRKIHINKILNLFLWFCAAAIAIAVVYGPYSPSYRVPQWAAVLYQSVFRFAMSLSIAWVIYACVTGNGGPVNSLLSWRGWLPLAHMNYCAYLLHLVVIFLYTFGFETLWHYSDFNFGMDYVAILVMTYSLAFVVATAVEIPCLSFEKVVIPDRKKKLNNSYQFSQG